MRGEHWGTMTDRDHIAADTRSDLQRTGRDVLRWGIPIGDSLMRGLGPVHQRVRHHYFSNPTGGGRDGR
jgi:hypothetical protein